jgi:hypothetical protein
LQLTIRKTISLRFSHKEPWVVSWKEIAGFQGLHNGKAFDNLPMHGETGD